MPTRKTFIPSDSVKQRISKWEGVAMTGSSIDPLSKKWVKQNNSFENEAALFSRALPESIRNHVLSNQDLADNLFSYSYNVGSGKFKRRVVPALVKYFNREGTAQDIADAMVAQGDTKLRGLKNRREQEKSGVLSAIPSRFNYGISFPLDTASEQPDALRVANPYPTQVNNTFITPTIVPDDYVKAHQVTMEEDRANRAMQRIEAAKKYNTLMQSIGMFNSTTPQFTAPYSVSPYAEGGRINTTSKWDTLSMAQKAKMIKVAVGNGITDLNEIKQKYNEFAEGGGISDEEYYSTMEKVAEDNYQKWGFGSPDEALVHALNDNTYNYRGYYNAYPQSTADASTHWPDEFKTVYHPTFSDESIYSGQRSQYNPLGLTGGYWVGDTFIPRAWQMLDSNKHSIGGPLVEAAMNEYANGGGIYIKPSHRGRLTELKKRTGKTEAELYRTGSPATRKMITFARNARKWKHGEGGNLFEDGEDSNSMNYEYRGPIFDDDLKKQGITHVAELPEIEVKGTKSIIQKPYTSAFNPYVGLDAMSSIAEGALSGLGTVLGGTLYYGMKPFIWLESALIPSETSEERKERIHKQNIGDKPYTHYIDAVRNDRRSEPSDPLYQSRLGLMGLVPDKNSEEVWHLKDTQGNYIKECAKFANHFNSMLGKPTTGDAWTTSGIYGDSLIYGSTTNKNKLPTFFNIPRMLLKRVTDIDRDNLETGDIVDLYSPFSHYIQRASREGRGNSHTGRIYKPEGKEGPTYIIHNVNGDINVEPIGKFMSPGSWRITRIARPGTKDKPYTNK